MMNMINMMNINIKAARLTAAAKRAAGSMMAGFGTTGSRTTGSRTTEGRTTEGRTGGRATGRSVAGGRAAGGRIGGSRIAGRLATAAAMLGLMASMALPAGGAFAAPSYSDANMKTAAPDTAAPGYSPADYPASPAGGAVTMTKSAAWTSDAEIPAEIKFEVSGRPVASGADVILVMDASWSMSLDTIDGTNYRYDQFDGTRLQSGSGSYHNWTFSGITSTGSGAGRVRTRTATLNVLTYENETHRRVVTQRLYGDGSDADQYWRPYIKAETNYRMSVVRGMSTRFIDAVLEKSPGNRVAVITFNSIVRETSSFGRDAAGLKATCNNVADEIGVAKSTYYNNALVKAKAMLDNRADKSRPAFVVFVSDGKPEADDLNYMNTANSIKNGGAAIITIGIDTDSEAKTILKNMASGASKAYVDTRATEMSRVYETVTSQLGNAGSDAVIEDTVNTKHFAIRKGSDVSASRGTVTVNTNTGKVTWNLGEITPSPATMTIKVEYTGSAGLGSGELYATNMGAAKLSYNNHLRHASAQTVGSPALSRPNTVVQVEYYLVNGAGQPVGKSGAAVPFADRVAINEGSLFMDRSGMIGPDAEALVPGGTYRLQNFEAVLAQGGAKYGFNANSAANGGNDPYEDIVAANYAKRNYGFHRLFDIRFEAGEHGLLESLGGSGLPAQQSIVAENLALGAAFPSAPAPVAEAGYEFSRWEDADGVVIEASDGSGAGWPAAVAGGKTYIAVFKADTSYSESVSNSVNDSVSNSVNDSIRASVDASISSSVDASISSSVNDSMSASVDASVSASVDASISASVNDSMSTSVNDSISASVDASVNDSISASVNDSISASVDASVNDSISNSVNDSI
ncbi:MAG: VWA domain-containing protein, partial [Clostridiales bacterium]|nr:VWA domain-containing protein [Clostridiales bacterium]